MTRNIVISGASSGLGWALALEYAAPGITLGLMGRDKDRLDEVAARAKSKGAVVRTAALDVRDREGMSAFLLAFDSDAPIDCVIASAGVTSVTATDGEPEDLAKSKDVFEVNLSGAMNTIAPIAPLMRRRHAGQIALFSSIAAFAPSPDAATYSASKAALVVFALATRALYRADGVSVSAICPGFVDTPMTGSYVSLKPFLITAEDAARRIRRGLMRRKAIIAFPLPLYLAARVQQLLPPAVQSRVMLAFRAKRRLGA